MAERKRRKSDATPALEWAAGVTGAIIFFGMIAVLLASGIGGVDTPPQVRVEVERIAPMQEGYVVEFRVRNEGETTAADVEIVATLQHGPRRTERRARFDYLPPRSVRRGGVFFADDPRAGRLTFRAEGYRDP